jgi:hypothetical protein
VRTTDRYKQLLRNCVLPLLNGSTSEDNVRNLIEAVNVVTNPNDPYSLTERQIDNVFKSIEVCDTICAFGPGHQSTILCDIRGDHEHHYNRSHRIEWDEDDVTDKTHDYRGKTYRLAFSNEGWY